jgi:hypothetical protein
MRAGTAQSVGRLVEYDALRRRLWILGQRCHHGAGGSILAAAACLALITEPALAKPVVAPSSAVALAAGALMMAHDWEDRSIWFERGRGSQR